VADSANTYHDERLECYLSVLGEVMSNIRNAKNEDELREGWNQFWLLQNENDSFDCGSMHTCYLVPYLFDRKVKTILCVGNGASWEAPALADSGFIVEVLDVSSEVKKRLERLALSPLRKRKILGGDYSVPGGSMTFQMGDFLDPSKCVGPYDVIIARRLLQFYPKEEWGTCIDALHTRLAAGGLLVLESQNARKTRRDYLDLLKARGFLVCFDFWFKGTLIYGPRVLSKIRQESVAWVISATG
jgi:hypothetical protein